MWDVARDEQTHECTEWKKGLCMSTTEKIPEAAGTFNVLSLAGTRVPTMLQGAPLTILENFRNQLVKRMCRVTHLTLLLQ